MPDMIPLRILFITPYKPDLIRVRPYQLLRHLAKLGHKITLVYYDSPALAVPNGDLHELCEEIHAFPLPNWKGLLNALQTLPSARPLQAAYGKNSAMLLKIKDLLSRQTQPYDVVHIEHLRSVDYGLKIKASGAARSIPCVWDSVDSITHLFRQAARQHPRWIARRVLELETRRTALYEPYAASRFEKVLVTSDTDRQTYSALLADQGLQADLQVLPNGVDLEYFAPNLTIQRSNDTLVVSGKMSYHANAGMARKLVREIMPLIWQKNPGVNLWIVGQNPPQDILNFAHDPRITVTGWVADIRPYLQQASVAVAPLEYGAGIQNKILEAMACGSAVIASPTAVQALQTAAGTELMVADNPQAFADLALELLSDPARRAKIGLAARAYVERHHSWENAAQSLTAVYHAAIAAA